MTVALAEPFRWDGDHVGVELGAGARALFTTRRGGVSEGPFASLDLSVATGDDARLVERNRARLARACGIRRECLTFGRQVHGAQVRRLDGPPPPDLAPEVDGHVTASPGVAAAVLTADCLPIALAGVRGGTSAVVGAGDRVTETGGSDGAGAVVAMLHGGWRGLAAGIVGEGVRMLRKMGADGPLSAAIGPGIGPCCYEVGAEVVEALGAPAGSRTVDLKAIARAQLADAGVDEIHDVGLCTRCHPELFFSHRRDGARSGRQAGVAWLAG